MTIGSPDKSTTRPGLARSVLIVTLHAVDDVRVAFRQGTTLTNAGYAVGIVGTGSLGVEKPTHLDPVVEIERPTRTPMSRIRALIQLARVAWRYNADVYHLHDPELLPLGVVLRLIARKTIVYDIHEYYDVKYAARIPVPYLRKPGRAAIWCFETFCAAIIGNVNVVSERMASRFRHLRVNVEVTPNYASTAHFSFRRSSLLDSVRPRVLHTGSLEPSRGSLILVDVVRAVHVRRPDVEFIFTERFLNEAHRGHMLASIENAGYKLPIRFVPHLPPGDLADLLSEAWVGLSLLQPVGQYPYSTPAKLFEYMSQGVPIVASDLPATRDLVGGHDLGTLVSPSDPDAYARAIIELLDDGPRRATITARAPETFLNRYSWESACAPRLLGLYERAIKKRYINGRA